MTSNNDNIFAEYNTNSVTGTTYLAGTGNTINAASGAVLNLDTVGSTNTLTASGATVFTVANLAVNDTGTGDNIYTSNNDSVDANNSNIYAEYNTGAVSGTTTVTGTNDFVVSAAGSVVDLDGVGGVEGGGFSLESSGSTYYTTADMTVGDSHTGNTIYTSNISSLRGPNRSVDVKRNS